MQSNKLSPWLLTNCSSGWPQDAHDNLVNTALTLSYLPPAPSNLAILVINRPGLMTFNLQLKTLQLKTEGFCYLIGSQSLRLAQRTTTL